MEVDGKWAEDVGTNRTLLKQGWKIDLHKVVAL